jgi:RimJ/RimL family protein N-acetyltransferase
MNLDIQPIHLKNEVVHLVPLQESDFDRLYKVASDPLVWEQHPNPNRYQKDVFRTYFEGAILSKGAFIVLNSQTNEVVGCSRFYDFNAGTNSIKIGYTFIGRKFWGQHFNKNMKSLMINHAFEKLENILFDIGANNIRSQIAISKIGAIKIDEQEIVYYGEDSKLNFVYQISKNQILRTTSENLDFTNLVQLLDADLKIRDGEEHEFYAQINKTAILKNVIVFYEKDIAVGCGAYREIDTKTLEIKRMFVLPEYRGKGIASKILCELELWALELNFTKTILETGINQPEAIALYKKSGYSITENYGQYIGMENSVCMQKILK